MNRGKNPFRSTSPGKALAQINKKYPRQGGQFYHRGNGVWVKYNEKRDKKIRRPQRKPKKREKPKQHRHTRDYKGKKW